jgi:hypothetical protein
VEKPGDEDLLDRAAMQTRWKAGTAYVSEPGDQHCAEKDDSAFAERIPLSSCLHVFSP